MQINHRKTKVHDFMNKLFMKLQITLFVKVLFKLMVQTNP